MVGPLRSPFSSGAQFDPAATIASLSISDQWNVCLEIPRVLLVVDAFYQLTHLPAHADARLALLWGAKVRRQGWKLSLRSGHRYW